MDKKKYPLYRYYALSAYPGTLFYLYKREVLEGGFTYLFFVTLATDDRDLTTLFHGRKKICFMVERLILNSIDGSITGMKVEGVSKKDLPLYIGRAFINPKFYKAFMV